MYTWHEKKKDGKTAGYGTNVKRIGKESVKSFDCCNLTLQPCVRPCITKDGILFDKEAILQYIITKKNEFARKMKEFEKQKTTEEKELQDAANEQEKDKLQRFLQTETKIVSGESSSSAEAGSSKISNMTGDKKAALPSFWAPSCIPDAKKGKVDKPDSKIYCPVTGRLLKAKDLIAVQFTKANGEKAGTSTNSSSTSCDEKYMCPITFRLLSNSVPCAVIRTTGHVICVEAVEKIIKKDWIHPLTNDKLEEKDIIYLQRVSFEFIIRHSILRKRFKTQSSTSNRKKLSNRTFLKTSFF